MTANPTLAKARGISSENQNLISGIHAYLDHIISVESPKGFNQEIFDEIETLEFELQHLWDFSQDADFHTWKNKYKFKTEWVGRTFICKESGVEFTIPPCVKEKDFFVIGKGFLNVGRLDNHSRFSGVAELINIEDLKD